MNEYDFISLSKDGLPNSLTGIGKNIFRTGDTVGIRVILTILSMGKLIPGDGILDTASITKEWNGKIPQDLLNFVINKIKPRKNIAWYERH